MRSPRLLMGTVVMAAVALASPSFAQHRGFFFTSPLTVTGGHESKFIVDDRELSDNVVLIELPTLSLLRLSPRGELSISYQPEYQAFATHHELSALDHNGELVFARDLSPQLHVGLGDTFISTADPSRRVVDSVLLLPRDRFMQNAFYADVARRFGARTTFSVRADTNLTRVAAPRTSQTGLIDRLATSGSVSLAQRLGRRHVVTWTYLYLDSRPLGDAAAPHLTPTGLIVPAPKPEHAHSGGMSYVYQGDTHSLSLTGGVVTGRTLSYTGSAKAEKTFGPSTFTFVAQRSLSFFAGVIAAAPETLGGGVAPLALYESLSARLQLEISRSLSLQAQAVAERTFSDLTAVLVRSDVARLRLDWRLSRTVALFGTTEAYRQSFNEFVGVPMNWQRYGVGFEVAVSGKPNPLEERRRARVLRERKERRGEEIEDENAPPRPSGKADEPKG
jgi:hypothetical protein